MAVPATSEGYKNHRFPGEILSHGVWLYYRFSLSSRDVEEMMLVRGIVVTHEAIRQWCLKFWPGVRESAQTAEASSQRYMAPGCSVFDHPGAVSLSLVGC